LKYEPKSDERMTGSSYPDLRLLLYLSLECLSFVSSISGQRCFPLTAHPCQLQEDGDLHCKKTEKRCCSVNYGNPEPMKKLVLLLHSAAFAPFCMLLPSKVESALWWLQKMQRLCGMAQSSVPGTPGVAMAESDPHIWCPHALCFVRYVALSLIRTECSRCRPASLSMEACTTAITLFWGTLEPSNRKGNSVITTHHMPSAVHSFLHLSWTPLTSNLLRFICCYTMCTAV
jgi:hypothetical protein